MTIKINSGYYSCELFQGNNKKDDYGNHYTSYRRGCRKQKNYLYLIQNLCDKYNIQYILTLIESDLPVLDGKKYELSERCNIEVELSDKDETTNLFGFKFKIRINQ